MLFWAQKYSILFTAILFQKFTDTGTTETSNCHRTLKKGDAARLSNSICTWIKPDHTQFTAASPPSYDFFAQIASKRNATIARPDADAEVESYLSDPSTELSSLEAYPNIRQVYLKLNTGLPASAAVERLFSLGGRFFAPICPVNILRWCCFCVQVQNGEAFLIAVGDGQWLSMQRY